jgi:hypothetical protein
MNSQFLDKSLSLFSILIEYKEQFKTDFLSHEPFLTMLTDTSTAAFQSRKKILSLRVLNVLSCFCDEKYSEVLCQKIDICYIISKCFHTEDFDLYDMIIAVLLDLFANISNKTLYSLIENQIILSIYLRILDKFTEYILVKKILSSLELLFTRDDRILTIFKSMRGEEVLERCQNNPSEEIYIMTTALMINFFDLNN